MKQIPINNYLVVETCEGAKEVLIRNGHLFYADGPIISNEDYINAGALPAGNWQIVGRCSEVDENVASEVVDKMLSGYENYGSDYPICFHSARESLKVFILHHSLTPSNCFLLKKM